MYGKREFLLGRQDRALPVGREVEPRRPRVVQYAAEFLAIALLGLCLPHPSRAQIPGPESFAQEPKTPSQLWSAIDYLIRTDQAAKAVPYLEKFLKNPASDEDFIALRDKYGIGSILRLSDDPATAQYAQPIADKLMSAARRFATQPERLSRLANALTGSAEEQSYAIARLKEAGPLAVPPVIEALARPGRSPEERALLARNLGRLDRSAVPPLLAVLESGNVELATDAATALGRIGDSRVVPFLIAPAASADSPPALREAARGAISRLTRKPDALSPDTASQQLAGAAWRYHRHQVEFPSDPVLVWSWKKEQNAPVPQSMSSRDAENAFGTLLAEQALKLQPQNLDAQAVHLSLALQKAIDRVGFLELSAQEPSTYADAKKAGPEVLTRVLRKAVADGRDDVGAVAAVLLGEVTDAAALARDGKPHPLVDALASPGARLQFAAARALANMAPKAPFPGSSRVVPVLSRFVMAQTRPRAIVIDSNPTRGSQFAGSLRAMDYEATLELRGDLGFRAAAETADVELIFVTYALERGQTWGLADTLANLKSDARTANLPIYVYGPLDLEVNRPNIPLNYPGVKFVVQPTSPEMLEKLIGGRPSRFSAEERARYAKQATEILARIAQQPGSPFESDLRDAEPALMLALNQPELGQAAATALGDIPHANAQRSLADVALDPARPVDLRRHTVVQLARSIKRFGPLVSANQEARLAAAAASESDSQLRTALENALTTLRSWAQSSHKVSLGVRTPDAKTSTPGPAAPGTSPR